MDEQTIKDAARLSAAARARKMAPRPCLRCGRPVKKPWEWCRGCRELAHAELRERILALPEKPMTQEVWERMWDQKMPPFERRHE